MKRETIRPEDISHEAAEAGARAIYDAIPWDGRRRKTWDQAHPEIRERLTIESRACIAAGLAYYR